MMDSVLLARPGFHDQVIVPVIDASCSWDVVTRGTFSGIVSRSVASSLPYDSLLGLWLVWETPAGRWGGVVRSNPYHLTSRYIELAADDFRVLLEPRVIGTVDLASKAAGGIARRLINEADSADSLLINTFAIESHGEAIAYQARDGSLGQAVDDVASQGGREWRVVVNDDYTLTLEFRESLGQDKTHLVKLIEGIHLIEGDYTPSLVGVANHIIGVAGDKDHSNATRASVEDKTSIQTYGRIQLVKEYPGMVSIAAIRPAIQVDLRKLKRPLAPITATVINIGNVYLDFAEGDTIRVLLQTAGVERAMRVTTRSYAAGVLSISGPSTDLVLA